MDAVERSSLRILVMATTGLVVTLVLGAVVQQCEGEPEPPAATPVVQLVSRG